MFPLGVDFLRKKYFLFSEIEIFFHFLDQFLNLNSKISLDFYWLMKNPNPDIKSGRSIGSYCSKARKYIEFAKGYRLMTVLSAKELIRNSYSVACVFTFLRF